MSKFDQKYSLFDDNNNNNKKDKNKEDLEHDSPYIFKLRPNIENYWQRAFSASIKVSEHIFNTPDNQYPLIYQKIVLDMDGRKMADNNISTTEEKKQWITANDVDYLILVMIYALLRLAWEKNILVLGLVKDIAAADMIKTVIPILQHSGKKN